MSTHEQRIPKITFVPLRDTSFISLLRSLRSVLCTSVGPSGNLKLLVSGGGYVQLAASSRHILQHHDQFHNPIVQFIVQIVKNQPEYGLYTGMIITSVLEKQLSLQMNNVIDREQSIDLLNVLMNTCDPVFNKLKIKINFDSVSELIPVVRTVLESKGSVFYSYKNITFLCLQIIKAFLFALDTNKMIVGDVTVHVYKGNDEYTFFPGLVYQLTDDDNWIFDILEGSKFKSKHEFKTLLFTTSLDNSNNDDVQGLNSVHVLLPKIYEILEKAINLGVNFIVCQKVVHRDVVLYLRRRSIIVLERLGTSLAKKFEQTTGSFPVSAIDAVSVEELGGLCGAVSGISIVSYNSRRFLLMESHSRCTLNTSTLMISTSSVAATEQLKILVEQAIRTLRALVSEPYVLPGAGCFEMSFFFSIQELLKETNHNTTWLLNVLKEASGNSTLVEFDSSFNHAWKTADLTKCNCRLISSDSVSTAEGKWYSACEANVGNTGNCVSDGDKLKLTADAIVDSFLLKRNAIIASIESCINLLNIGTVAYKETDVKRVA